MLFWVSETKAKHEEEIKCKKKRGGGGGGASFSHSLHDSTEGDALTGLYEQLLIDLLLMSGAVRCAGKQKKENFMRGTEKPLQRLQFRLITHSLHGSLISLCRISFLHKVTVMSRIISQ